MTEPEEEAFPVRGIPDFWHRLRSAPRKCLALDYDGTLAPFREDRMTAFPLDGVTECLSKIAGAADTTLAIVSGRPVEEILKLVGDIGVTIVGSHGWEIRTEDGSDRLVPPAPEQERRLRQAEDQASKRGLGERAERKLASLAVHTRGMPLERAAEIENGLARLWEHDSAEHGVECRRFDGGVELRSRGIDKGTILHELLNGEARETFCVYVGDDETDEDAFREIRERGLGIRVGEPDTPTQAVGWLPDCSAVLEFLREWIHVASGRRA